jgi:hypothetical protein
VPISQSIGRVYQPLNMSGSYVVLNTSVPNVLLFQAPHWSPPDARRSCAAGFKRSQSGLKLPLASFHDRPTVVWMRLKGLPSVHRPSLDAESV